EEAIRIALKSLTGAYVILVIAADQPDTIIACRNGSPWLVGIDKIQHFIGSDANPIVAYTKDVVYINDYELAIVKPAELILKNLGNELITPFAQKLDLELAAIEKGGYDHFMLKEICVQSTTIADSLRGRLILNEHRIILSGVDAIQD